MAEDVHQPEGFEAVSARLDEIVEAVRKKDTSLERSLDLLEEAIGLGDRAVALVDSTEFGPKERASMARASAPEGAGEASGTDAGDPAGAAAPSGGRAEETR